jgi:hypothetical protein
MVLPLIFGAANAGLGIFSAISGAQQQNEATRLANEQAMEVYKRQLLKKHAEDVSAISLFNKRKARYQNQVFENQTAADRAYFAEQSKLNEIIKGMRFKSQAMMVEQAKAQGKAAASGQQGRSAGRLSVMIAAAQGRNQAILDEQLRTANQNLIQNNENTRNQLRISNDNAYFNVGAVPIPGVAPLAPAQRQGANPTATALGIGTSILNGVQSGMDFKQKMDNLGWD